ncbi:hypothetical protein DAPPUDRAFT_235928 [Daphnia pulex]|uniref:Uncharacterized protein n=1 Tax=Daphnia pulex TaxID=6669 RepID=E9FZF5_DAPPU|nr:hypothetical protein DAPPUDRAFT_235928 [Daphnia pulex]|eukprot:EFX87047.1 hypothetical protein DAPPUDRAFT_235928 [Daphnia pulex]
MENSLVWMMEKQPANEKPTFNAFSAASSVTKTNNSIAFVRHTSNIPVRD